MTSRVTQSQRHGASVSNAPPTPRVADATVPAFTGSDVAASLLEVAFDSLFGDAYSEAAQANWQPLGLRHVLHGRLERALHRAAGRERKRTQKWLGQLVRGDFFPILVSFVRLRQRRDPQRERLSW